MDNYRLLQLFLSTFFTINVDSTLTSWPHNTEVLLGQSVRLSCSTSDIYNVNWEHIPSGTRSKHYVFFGGGMIIPYHKRFSVNRTLPNSYDLFISSVKVEDSGKYRCIDREGQGEQREAELIVLESSPYCYSEAFIGTNSCNIAKQEQARVFCGLSYSGNIAPSVDCSGTGNDVIRTEVEPRGNNISYTFFLTPNASTFDSKHSCRTSLSKISSNSFHFNVSNVIESQNHMTIQHPSHVSCSANSTEPCTYTWVGENGEVASSNDTIEINHPGIYKCNAFCPIAGKHCNITCLEVIYTLEADSPPNAAAVAVPVVIIVAVGLVLVACIVRYKKKRKNFY